MSLQEDAKKILPFVQAMADGKAVEWKSLLTGEWIDCHGINDLPGDQELRIKPSKKWRPYTREEIERDVIRVRSKGDGRAYLVTLVAEIDVYVGGLGSFKFSEVLDSFTNLDGTPCGVEVEE